MVRAKLTSASVEARRLRFCLRSSKGMVCIQNPQEKISGHRIRLLVEPKLKLCPSA